MSKIGLTEEQIRDRIKTISGSIAAAQNLGIPSVPTTATVVPQNATRHIFFFKVRNLSGSASSAFTFNSANVTPTVIQEKWRDKLQNDEIFIRSQKPKDPFWTIEGGQYMYLNVPGTTLFEIGYWDELSTDI